MVEHTRTLDFKIAFAIGLGTMIAAGIFSLSGTAVAKIGSSAVIGFVIAAIVAGLTAASYSEFASIYSENGGGYLFASRTFENDVLIYTVGAMLFLGYTGTTAFYLATMDEWVVRFILPESLAFLPHGTSGIAAAVLLGVLNARGTEESGTFQLLVTGAKVAVLFAFIGGAFAFRGPSTAIGNFAGAFSTDVAGIIEIAALAFITFFGFSAIAASAGEIIEPKRTVPLAIGASIITVTVLYALVIIAMVNSPVPAEVIAQEGETAMGRVAAGFIGPVGRSLIVAGAIFSMVSASNASILAASGIGSLMGRQGQAPRPLSRIHRTYNTPFWSVAAATTAIVVFITLFIGLFPAEGGPVDIVLSLPVLGAVTFSELGLTTLTGFATLNLLLPLSIVNVALVYSRRRFPEIERGFRVPGVPVLPAVGIVANLALITSLPTKGVIVGFGLIGLMLAGYLWWGGAPDSDDLYEQVVAPGQTADGSVETSGGTPEPDDDVHRILVDVTRPEYAPRLVRLAATLGNKLDDDPFIQVITVTQIPEQTTSGLVAEAAEGRVERTRSLLEDAEIDAEYSVEGHVCRDVAFDIVQTARTDDADLILMSYRETATEIAETVGYDAPCGVLYASDLGEAVSLDVVNVGAGNGPHHMALLGLVEQLGQQGSDINVINVSPAVPSRQENAEATVAGLTQAPSVRLQNRDAQTVAEGLVEQATANGGLLIVGASPSRRLGRRVFGSTPDEVIERARRAGVPVLVYASPRGVRSPLEDYFYTATRTIRKRS